MAGLFLGVILFNFGRGIDAFHLEPSINFMLGSESNVNKSPQEVEGVRGLPQQDFWVESKWGAKFKHRWGKDKRLELDYQGFSLNYSSNSVLNENGQTWDWKYQKLFTKQNKFSLKAGLEKARKRATDIFGEGLTRPYSYFQSDLEPRVSLALNPALQLEMEYQLKNKDYEEISGKDSLDYWQNKFGVRTEYRVFSLDYNFAQRFYKKYPASDERGLERLTYPKRRWNYHNFSLAADKRWGEYGSSKIIYQFQNRLDLFRDYYTYSQQELKGKTELKLPYRFGIEIEASYKVRKYKVEDVPVPGPNPKLKVDYFDYQLKIIRWLKPALNIFLQYAGETRDTNKETGSTWREYKNYLIMGGLTWEYKQK